MFVWMKLHFENHPTISLHGVDSLELQLWELLAQAGVLVAPGSMFSACHATGKREGHFRVSFSQTAVSALVFRSKKGIP